MSGVPDTVEEIKEHILARREAVAVCMHEITLLSERLRIKLGPVEWLNWMQTSVKDGQDDLVAQFVKKQQEAAGGDGR